jgi:uncharacterized protein (DUF4415 family)
MTGMGMSSGSSYPEKPTTAWSLSCTRGEGIAGELLVPEKQPKQSRKRSTARSIQTRGGDVKTDWKQIDKRKDADVRRAIRTDPDAAPELDQDWFRRAKFVVPEPKQAVSIRLDRDVMEWFRRQGRGYQTRINAVLRTYVDAHRKSHSDLR